jgi:hypothetical protein
MNNTKDFDFTPKTMLSLFDSFVSSILSYSSEVWGFTKNKDIERIHLKFCKRILNVKLSSSSVAIYGELGRYPLYVNRCVKIVKYFLKIKNSNNCIISKVYELLLEDLCNNKINWVSKVKKLLYEHGFGYVFETPLTVNVNHFITLFRQRLIDTFTQNWSSDLESNQVLHLYKHLKHHIEYAEYLSILSRKNYRSVITKFRISAHCLRIETGRYGQNRIERGERTCNVCQSRDIEDEFHMICVCPCYRLIRKRYIDKYYYERPSMFKLTQLLSTRNEKMLNNLVCFLNCALRIRHNLLQ